MEKTIEFYKKQTNVLVKKLEFKEAKNKKLINEKQDLIKKSFLDSLTWLYNQSFLDKKIEETENVFDVVSLDIKEFKEINDKLWQDEWNKILNKIWNILLKNTKNINSYAIRNWGDEFILLIHKDQNRKYILRKINKELKSIHRKELKVKFSTWISEYNKNKPLKELVIEANTKASINKTKNGKIYRIFSFIENLDENTIKKIIEVLKWILKEKSWLNDI